jgi:hypothetical protein
MRVRAGYALSMTPVDYALFDLGPEFMLLFEIIDTLKT